MPITWQNVTAPSNEGAMRGFAAAGQNFDSAFDKLGGILKGAETAKQYQLDQADDANVLALKEALAGARTPEDVMALQGQLAQMRSGLTNKGRSAVLGAEDARTTSLQQQITARNVFNAGVVADGRNTVLGNVRAPMELENAQAVVDNAPMVRALDRAALVQRGTLQPITDATALTAAQNAGRAATFAGTRAPGQEALTLREDSLRGNTLTVQAKQTQDTLEDQNLSVLTAKTAAAYQTAMTQDKVKLGALATQLKLPVDAGGAPDLSRISDVDLAKLNQQATAAGLRTTGQLSSGDTQTVAKFSESLVGQGFSAEAVARNQAKIGGAFNTVSNGAAVGNDAYNNAVKQAKVDTAQEAGDKENWNAPNSPNAMKNYEELIAQIAPDYDQSKGSDKYEDLPYVQELFYKAATTGIEIKPGVFLTPSKQDMMAAVRKHGRDNFVLNYERADAIERTLKANLSTARVSKLIIQSEASKGINEARSIREKVRESLGIGAPAKK